MTAASPVRHYLTEISGDVGRQSSDGGRFGRGAGADAELRIEEARTRGMVDGRAAAEAEYAASLAAREALFEERLAAERQKWAADEGARLGELLASTLLDIERRISEQVGRILRPVFGEEVRRAAVSALALTLRDMVAKGAYARIAVSGPSDLLAALQAGLGDEQGGVSFVVSERADIVVNADDTVLETRIGAWAKFLEGGDALATAEPSCVDSQADEAAAPPPTSGATA